MPVQESVSKNPSRSIAAIAMVVLVLVGLAGGWVLLGNSDRPGGLDDHVMERPAGR